MTKFSRWMIALPAVLILMASIGGLNGQGRMDEDFLKFFRYREMGPARQGGRILDVVALESDSFIFYVAASTGGLWKTINNGTTWTGLFQKEGTTAIGDFAVAPSNPDILWIGTGDPASGRISLLGDGIYKSTDAGKTWTQMGLKDTIHIGRIAIHPKDPDVVYAAALGYHFTDNEERGIYKTSDGGQSWEKVLFVSPKVGFVDVAVHPEKPDIVFAVSYDKKRVPWNFVEWGPETAIYKSTDAGKTWKKLSAGLPTGNIGRIGVDFYAKNPDIIYATVENGNMRPPTKEEIDRAKQRGREAGEQRISREVYRTENAGETWLKTHEGGLPWGGKWYGEIRVDPNDDQVVYLPGVPVLRSTDGGKTWGGRNPVNIAGNVHVDNHGLWIDPANSNHIIMGGDGGLAVTYDWGKNWEVFENLPLAQYYAVGVDMEEPYSIYGGLQDNGSVKFPSNSPTGVVTNDDWESIGGGDGMFNLVDPHDGRWLYNSSQFGYLMRTNQETGERTFIRPSRPQGEPPLRFHWTTPMAISHHNSHILYAGSQVVHRSLDQGDHWEEISPDLSTQNADKLKGNIEHCLISTLSESPKTANVIWAGTDDGKVQVTLDGGGQWLDRTAALTKAGVPEEYYVARVFASFHEPGRAYVVKTGFQYDNFVPYVFKTEDYGKTWTNISGNLPQGIVYVLVEDRKNPDLLFIGRDFDVRVTLDRGKKWFPFRNNMPTVSVFDLVIHPRENDLIAATHGRGIFMTDITPLQQIDENILGEDVFLFAIEPKIQWQYRIRGGLFGQKRFNVPNERLGVPIIYYLKSGDRREVEISVKDVLGKTVRTLKAKGGPGLNQVLWDMRGEASESQAGQTGRRFGRDGRGPLLPPGGYLVELKVGDRILSLRAVIRPMPGK
jgi:photosystem II stability/assembly factor-like uncharacterized protein